jgi:hypothetical protein
MQADVEEDRLEIADFSCWDILLRYYGGDAPDDGLRCVPDWLGRAWFALAHSLDTVLGWDPSRHEL